MAPLFRVPLALALFAVSSAFGQGGTAIGTLNMPPPGGEGISALQTGGAIPIGAASLYYNPALLAELHRATGSRFHASHSRQNLWGFDDINQNFTGFALVIPDSGRGFDFGVGLFRNRVNLGEVLGTGEEESTFEAYETVYGLGAGVRLGLPVQVGGTIKFYDSYWGDGVTSGGETVDARAMGWAFDIGFTAVPRLRPLTPRGILSVEVAPSFGMALQNMGAAAWYVSPEQSDPLPTTWRSAAGVELDFAEVFRLSVSHDLEKTVHRRASWDDPWRRTYGLSASLLGFRYGVGWLKDAGEEQAERNEALEYELNLKRLRRVAHRVRTRDFVSAGEALNVGAAPGARRGILRDANPRLIIGRREIVSGRLTGNDAWYFAVSL